MTVTSTDAAADRPWRTADVADRLGDAAVCLPMAWLRLGGRRVFRGEISTVRCHEAVGLIRQAIAEPGAGRVLVVDGGGSRVRALVGDRMATLAAANGWAGLVVHGAVRDADALEAIDIGLFALATVPARASGDATGERDVPVTLGGIQLHPGDHLFCDADGLVLCSPAEARRLIDS